MADTWPPVKWLWAQYRANAAWYSGDPDELRAHAAGFWQSAEKTKIHIPLAGDLAALAAGFLFSDSPIVKHANEKTNDRLQEIMSLCGLYQKLLQAAELQAVYGGVFVKWNWDTTRAPYPLFRVVPADAGLPYYANGILTSIRFWSVARVDEDNGGAVWRTEETYTPDGRILTRLLRGSVESLGTAEPLNAIPETADIQPEANSGTGMLLATYVPARLPNRLRPYAPYGRSDFDGLRSLFSALDEAYSSMIRDIKLGKTQVIVPAEYLRQKKRMFEAIDQAAETQQQPQFAFAKSDEVFVALDYTPDAPQGKDIVPFQPLIRAEEHLKTIEDIVRRIVTLAGYAPQSAGLDIEGRAESGTALNVRERRSMQTAETKKTYWWHALMDMMRAGLALDKALFTRGLALDGDLAVEFADNTQPDMQTLADTLDKLERAGAVSTDTKVRLLHPDWEDDQVEEEIERIQEERGLISEGEPDPGLGDLEAPPPGTPEDDDAGGE